MNRFLLLFSVLSVFVCFGCDEASHVDNVVATDTSNAVDDLSDIVIDFEPQAPPVLPIPEGSGVLETDKIWFFFADEIDNDYELSYSPYQTSDEYMDALMTRTGNIISDTACDYLESDSFNNFLDALEKAIGKGRCPVVFTKTQTGYFREREVRDQVIEYLKENLPGGLAVRQYDKDNDSWTPRTSQIEEHFYCRETCYVFEDGRYYFILALDHHEWNTCPDE